MLVFLATLGGVLANRLKVPPVLGLLLIGALAGPQFLALVPQGDTVALFSEIGGMLLLFAIGLEFSLSKVFSFGARALAFAVFKLFIVFFLSFQLGQALGLGGMGSLYLGAILAVTSTALMVKVVEQKGYLKRREVGVLVASLVVEDFFAVFALAVFSGMGKGGVSAAELASSIEFSLLLLVAVYALASWLLGRVLDYFLKYQAHETMTLLALGVGVGFSYVAGALGLSPSIGAFLAGSMVASLPRGDLLSKSVSPFIFAFSSIFFLSIGMLIDFSSIYQNLALVVVLIAANAVFKFAGSYASGYLSGFSGNEAAFSGIAMQPVGEFSLLMARQGDRFVGFDLVGVTSAVTFFSTLTASLSLDRFREANAALNAFLPRPLKSAARGMARAFSEAFASIERAGKSSWTAVKLNWFYWASGVFYLALGWAAETFFTVASLSSLTGFAEEQVRLFPQITVLAAALVLTLGVQRSVVALAGRTSRSVEKLSHALSLVFFALLLPFVAVSFGAGFGETELFFLIVGVLLLFLVYHVDEGERKGEPVYSLFFKK